MSLYFTMTRKKILFTALLFILLLLITARFFQVYASNIDGSTAEARARFAKSIGCTLEDIENFKAKTIIIPQEFSDVYINYNKLQQKAGFDLSPYKGCNVTVYTYPCVSFDDYICSFQMNLIVYCGRIIGGDISETSLNGKMLPLIIE